MKIKSNQAIFIFFVALALLALYLLAPILTPFLFGALLAYLTDPLVRYLDKRKVPHILSTTIVFTGMILAVILLILMLIPFIQAQVNALINAWPQISTWFQDRVLPLFKAYFGTTTVKETITASAPKSAWVFSTVLQSGFTVIDWGVSLVLIPIVTFYLLRDWDDIISGAKSLIPQSIKPTVVRLARECDEVLGAFFRGQLLVMLCLCIIYGVGLMLIGLQVGFILGVIGGILSIVPYLGSIFVVVTASIAALVQFGTWQSLIWVLVVYMIGQIIEGYILTPYLVGERIGLHPVAVIFAIMAGGSLFGFFGVLLALPVAAVVMVLFRYLREKYQ